MENQVNGIWLEFGDERIFLKTAIIGGELGDESPIGMYSGRLDVGDFGVALMHCNRAAIKVLKDTFEFDTISVQGFLTECMMEALRREKESQISEKLDYQAFKNIHKKSKDAL
jgi:hypothetical protein